MRRNTSLKVMVANGYYDMITPFFDAEITFARYGIPQERVAMTYYQGGHMMYLNEGALEALYLTVSAVGMWDAYFKPEDREIDMMLQIVRYAAIAAPVVGLLFAFSGQLGRSLARLFNLNAARHIAIAGDSPAALSLALDSRRRKDSVILIAQDLPEETALGLRRKGVIVLEGDATHIDTLRTARAHHAAHVVAYEPDDTANLQIEAAVRRLVGNARRRPPIGVHVATRSAMLLKEAREMRSAETRKKKSGSAPIDPKPFSLEEMAARSLLQRESQTILSVAQELKQDRVHIVLFGRARVDEPVVGAFRAAAAHCAGAGSGGGGSRVSRPPSRSVRASAAVERRHRLSAVRLGRRLDRPGIARHSRAGARQADRDRRLYRRRSRQHSLGDCVEARM